MNADQRTEIIRTTLAAGGTTADLARALGCSWTTAKYHRQRYEWDTKHARMLGDRPSVAVASIDDDKVLSAIRAGHDYTRPLARALFGGEPSLMQLLAVWCAAKQLVERGKLIVIHPTRGKEGRWRVVDPPLAVLRIVVDCDDLTLLCGLSSAQADKLAAGIVCTSYPHGVAIAWGLQVGRAEQTQTFVDVEDAIVWLLDRADGLRSCAALCPTTQTAVYSLDRAAFLSAAATILRQHAPRLWG